MKTPRHIDEGLPISCDALSEGAVQIYTVFRGFTRLVTSQLQKPAPPRGQRGNILVCPAGELYPKTGFPSLRLLETKLRKIVLEVWVIQTDAG